MTEEKKYYILYHNAVYGSYTIEELELFLTPATLVCRVGEDTWHTASDVEELKPLLQKKATRLEPEQPPGFEYYVLHQGKEYGPYSLEQLKEFVTKATQIRIGKSNRYIPAFELAELYDFFEKKEVSVEKYWFYYDDSGKEFGPFSRQELINLIKEGKITAQMKFKHITWNIPVILSESKLYKEVTSPTEPGKPEPSEKKRFEWYKFSLFIFAFAVLLIGYFFPKSAIKENARNKSVIQQETSQAEVDRENIKSESLKVAPIFGSLSIPREKEACLVVTMVDVGQGDGFIIVTPSKKVYIIDAGTNSTTTMIPYLGKLGITNIEAVIMSHPHTDHIGGIEKILLNFPVKEVYDPGYPHTTAVYKKLLELILNKGINYINPRAGDEYTFADNIRVQIFHPDRPEYSNINNNSIVCKLTYNKTSILFTGDAEEMAEKIMLNKYGDQLRADVLKVGHHGSTTSTTEEWLSRVQPKIALISCGVGNSYGHPHTEVIERLGMRNIEIYRTDLMGFVILRSDGMKWSVTTHETLYDDVHFVFDKGLIYYETFDEINFLKKSGWSEMFVSGRADISGGALTLYAEPREQIYTKEPSGPLILKQLEIEDGYTVLIKMQGSEARNTDGAIVIFGDKWNWVSLSCAESRNISLTNTNNTNQNTEYFYLKKKPIFYAIEFFRDNINIAISENRKDWVVIRRYKAAELGFSISDAQIGLSANSRGYQQALAFFFEYAEYSSSSRDALRTTKNQNFVQGQSQQKK
ncbi:MAG: GYF domain-containing protein [Candidatus Hydrogenedentota bacterium]